MRGENILSSKAEYSRCQVQRLRIDLEGWKEKVGNSLEKAVVEESATAAATSLQEEPQVENLVQEAEESLADIERDIKRKQEMQAGPAGRKPKRRRMVTYR